MIVLINKIVSIFQLNIFHILNYFSSKIVFNCTEILFLSYILTHPTSVPHPLHSSLLASLVHFLHSLHAFNSARSSSSLSHDPISLFLFPSRFLSSFLASRSILRNVLVLKYAARLFSCERIWRDLCVPCVILLMHFSFLFALSARIMSPRQSPTLFHHERLCLPLYALCQCKNSRLREQHFVRCCDTLLSSSDGETRARYFAHAAANWCAAYFLPHPNLSIVELSPVLFVEICIVKNIETYIRIFFNQEFVYI